MEISGSFPRFDLENVEKWWLMVVKVVNDYQRIFVIGKRWKLVNVCAEASYAELKRAYLHRYVYVMLFESC
jgi:hypothetical protein